ncbi:MAG: type 4a pilus biogenesis protein PilO [Candidatus Nitrohelix vancouverensis]|uniref:Type 4a pilus biogenesis protein PilO n=1 Tax=Candidatus Nitrohelix vancouverensis TaxID=2705534 RepID=A0A7T0G2R6_9BACT|nr:MAG: type 4a pilus biogenesis protein PilO [Candidatus Nitrohelix vancouverensis]
MDHIFDKLPYDFLENIKSAYVILTGVVVGLLLAVIYFFTIYSAIAEEYAGLVSNRENVKRKLDQYQRTVKQKEMVSRQLISMEGKLSLAKKQLPRGEELPNLLKELSSFGQGRSDFAMMRFQLEEGEIIDFYKEVPFNIEMRGSFTDTMDFFDKMENALRLIGLTELTMRSRNMTETRNGEQVIQPTLFTDFTATTFAYVEGAESRKKEKKK